MNNGKQLSANYSAAMSKRRSNNEPVAEHESRQARRAMRDTCRRIRRIAAPTRVAKWIGRHPVAMVCAAAGVSVAVMAYICTAGGEASDGERRSSKRRRRTGDAVRRVGRFLLVDWLGQFVLKPATSGFSETCSAEPVSPSVE